MLRRAGIIGLLRKAMQTGADPRAYAAVDLLLQLLQHCQRSHPIDDCTHLLAPLDGPKLLAGIGKAALERGVLDEVPKPCLFTLAGATGLLRAALNDSQAAKCHHMQCTLSLLFMRTRRPAAIGCEPHCRTGLLAVQHPTTWTAWSVKSQRRSTST